jgi:FtsZ-interacting cell division protein ZipA
MWILRLILIFLGIAFIVGVYLYTRRYPPRPRRTRQTRSEPSIVLQEVQLTTEARKTESYVPIPDEPSMPVPDSGLEPKMLEALVADPIENDQVSIFSLILRLPREGVEAACLLHQLERLGLVLNDQHIYHRIETDGEPAFSVANLFEPGTLHPLSPDALLQGLNFFFMGVPSSATSVRFDRMLGTACECARSFGGQMEDAQHRPLTAVRELELKLSAVGAHKG